MGILNIRPAERAGAKAVIGIAGVSGSGKTFTALKIARGMVNSASEIGFLDTENKRGSLYSDILDGKFMIGDLYPPFSPARYAMAIKEFQDAGVKVLVVDSVSHEHEGEGGITDIAENTTSKIPDWKTAKAEHKKFMNVLLQADMHIIVCVRAREQMDFRIPSKPVSLGIQPVCEKNFMFEMTASIMMFNEGYNQDHLKVPKDLKSLFGNGSGYLGEDTGRGIIEWLKNGAQIDSLLISWSNKLQAATSGGMKELGKVWSAMPKHIQAQLVNHKEQCKASAEAYDLQEAQKAATKNEEPAIEPTAKTGFNPLKPANAEVVETPAAVQQESTSADTSGPAESNDSDISNF